MKNKNNWWMAVGATVLAAAASLYALRKLRLKKGEKPPANAPQLELGNPGDQSEFPAAPSGAQELG